MVTSNQAQATITHGPQTSKITPTSVTCKQFAAGGATDLFDTYYYLGIQYNAGSLMGAAVSQPYPEVTYVNGVEILSSWDGIAANYKK